MFIDTDEFVAPISTKTIPEFLKDFEQFGGVEINWVLYGSSGHNTITDGLVIERFKHRRAIGDMAHTTVKTIAVPHRTTFMDNHYAHYALTYFAVNADKEKSDQWFCQFQFSRIDKIRINHYYTKSYEEWVRKLDKGQATNPGQQIVLDSFYFWDADATEIDTTMDKYIPLIYENLKKRKENAY
jgi:hypothetical protein